MQLSKLTANSLINLLGVVVVVVAAAAQSGSSGRASARSRPRSVAHMELDGDLMKY